MFSLSLGLQQKNDHHATRAGHHKVQPSCRLWGAYGRKPRGAKTDRFHRDLLLPGIQTGTAGKDGVMNSDGWREADPSGKGHRG